jgi:hypothetical protein
MMIAPPPLGVGERALDKRRPSEFSTPNDERILEEAALL